VAHTLVAARHRKGPLYISNKAAERV